MNNKLVNTLVIVCVGLSLLVVLTACSTSSGGATVTITAPAEPETVYTIPAEPTDDELFLGAVRATGNSMLMSASDDSLIGAARATCDMFEAGYSVIDVMALLISDDPSMSDETAEGFGVIIGGAVPVYCPEYIDDITALGY